MRLITVIAVALLVATTAPAAQDTDVFVLGALGALHDREETFGFATLDRIVRRLEPDVVLLEVTPEELADKLDTRGRPEYPQVVWPMLAESGAPRAFAMEAGQPLYGELTGNGVMLDVAAKAIAEHPGKRVLVLGSFRNRFTLVKALGALPGVTLADMHAWLVANGFGSGTGDDVRTWRAAGAVALPICQHDDAMRTNRFQSADLHMDGVIRMKHQVVLRRTPPGCQQGTRHDRYPGPSA